MKICPKAIQHHEKWTLESWEFQPLWKLIFAILPLQNAWFSNPRHPDPDPQIIRKRNLETSIKKCICFKSKVSKKLIKWGPSSKNHSKTQAWTPKYPLLCSPVSKHRPSVPQDAKVKPPSMQSDKLAYQKCQDPLATIPRICNPRAMSNGRRPAAEGAALG